MNFFFFLVSFLTVHGRTSHAFLARSLSFVPHAKKCGAHGAPCFAVSTGQTTEEEIGALKEKQNGKEPAAEAFIQRNFDLFHWKNYAINYRAEGPEGGSPILLVHGFGASVNHFRYQFPVLVQEGYRVYAVDLLGFGASDKPSEETYSIELWGELLVDFIEYIDNQSRGKEKQPWVIAGNSIGGLVSLLVSTRIPQKIAGCVLFNTSGGMTGIRYEELPWFLRPLLYAVQNIVFKGPIGKQIFENFKTRQNVETILKESGVYRDITNVDEALLEMLLGPSDDEGAKDVFLKVLGGPAGPTPESLLPQLNCPVLALWGDSDPWTPVDAGLHPGINYGQYCENYELVVLPNTGHCPHDERPDLCHQSLLPWLKMILNKE